MTLLTTIEAAALLRICPSSVRKLCDEKRLKCIRHSPNGKRLILAESVEAYIASLTDDVETYSTRSVGDYNCIFSVTIASRTKSTITTTDGKKFGIAKKETEWNNAETIFPMGRYSMAPAIKAQ